MMASPNWLAAALLGSLAAAPAAHAANIAGAGAGGAAILGTNDTATPLDAGTARVTPAANLGAVNDGLMSPTVHTYASAANTEPLGFVGVKWAAPRTDSIRTLTLTLACYGDGGWFGNPYSTRMEGSPLPASNLIEPTVQVTVDGGTTWIAAPATSDYVSQFTGVSPGVSGTAFTPRAFTMTLTSALTGINGIRIIGQNAGWNAVTDAAVVSTDNNGYLAVVDLAVNAVSVLLDIDLDGMDDTYETDNGLNVGANDSAGDPDADGLSNYQEFLAGTKAQIPDTDLDGLSDGPEVLTYRSNPNDTDTDDDTLLDGAEVAAVKPSSPIGADSDGDGLTDVAENTAANPTHPGMQDSDGDTFSDAREGTLATNPNDAASRNFNIARAGYAFIGTNDAVDGDSGFVVSQTNIAANISNLNDGSQTTRGQNVSGPDVNTIGQAGIVWASPVPAPIEKLELTTASFADGGWFGPANSGPGAGGPLLGFVTAPALQKSMDGLTWTTVPASDYTFDYADRMNPNLIGGGAIASPSNRKAVLNLSVPLAGVRGVRFIGTQGGTSGGGFLGVFEITALDSVSVANTALDFDADTLTNAAEAIKGTNPHYPDTDDDLLSDAAEINTNLTDPLDADSDDDGFVDGAEVALATNPLLVSSRLPNLSRGGFGIAGVTTIGGTTNGTTVAGVSSGNPVFNSGTAANIVDGNQATRVDTFSTAAFAASFAGVRWTIPQTVLRVEMTVAAFTDGGWFGPNAASPGEGNALVNPTHLTVPSLQTTVDGVFWTTVPAADYRINYIARMTGHVIGSNSRLTNPAPRKFHVTLNAPVSGIKGIRLIGSEGGVAGAPGAGFLGIFDFTVKDSTSAGDLDGDGLTNADEVVRGTDPDVDDSDNDGLTDGNEVLTLLSNPLSVDSDGDLYRDNHEVSFAGNPANPAIFPANLSLIGTGIIGTNDAIDADAGIPGGQAGFISNLTDANAGTRIDTYNGAGTNKYSYTGAVWTLPQTVKTVTVTLATFTDGGWWGVNSTGPASGGALTAAMLVEPSVQVTMDGTTWFTVPSTSNYIATFTGHIIGSATVNPSSRPATFTLTTAVRGIRGVRVIGSEGGAASAGFLGVFEVNVNPAGVAGDMDNDGLPDAWELSNFGTVQAQYPFSDFDSDGSLNLTELGFGMNPQAFDLPPAAVIEGGYLTMTITKQPGVTYAVLSGAELPLNSAAETTVLADDATTLKVRDNFLITGPAMRRFMDAIVFATPSP